MSERPATLTDEQRSEILRRHQAGDSNRAIAAEFGVTVQWLGRFYKNPGIDGHSQRYVHRKLDRLRRLSQRLGIMAERCESEGNATKAHHYHAEQAAIEWAICELTAQEPPDNE